VFAAAAIAGLFLIGFLALAGAEALDLVLPRWAAMLIVAGVFAVIVAIAIAVARASMRSAATKPELTQASLKEDIRWAKRQLKR
jgi:Putative Actinobacterial Holin-X, holin superfamily III